MSEERAAKKLALEENQALAWIVHEFFCSSVYVVHQPISSSYFLRLTEEVWKVCQPVDKLVNLRTFHATLYGDICMAVKLYNATLREMLTHISVLRRLYWEQYKALRLLRIFSRDLIWMILSHLGLVSIPTPYLLQNASKACMGMCGTVRRAVPYSISAGVPPLWGNELWEDMWNRARQ